MTVRWTEEQYRAHVLQGQPLPYSEAAWQRAVLRLAKDAGYMIYHTYNSKKSPIGFPDLVLAKGPTLTCARGKLVFAELKTDTGQVTKAQQAWINTLQAIEGVECFVWRPADWKEIEGILRYNL